MRPAVATIDLAALRHNLRRVRELAPHSRVVAVVKANGYGHGAARLLPGLGEADMLGVACIEEALALREAAARQPVLLMEGVFEAAELADCARLGFEIAVHEPGQIAMLERSRLDRPLVAWLKVDTGMTRLGFRPEAAEAAWRRLRDCPNVGDIRLMTHFANADMPEDTHTPSQLARFARLGLPGQRSLANSAAVLAWPEAHGDWVRPGIMLYGVSPLLDRTGEDEGLLPVMTLATRLIAVKEVRAHETVGYAASWTSPGDGRIGIAAMGYGDGYPRHAPSGTPVLVRGRTVPLVGRVSMDMVALDLSQLPEAGQGDEVVLWGPGLAIEGIASLAGTIAYELLCGITGRVHVRVIDDGPETTRNMSR
ncbi:MAG TPA: alanine racemase [Geminicoccaceae bacterium]|nr:alanine racemase [Geminicoccus sp.]HMU51249.1 alanine racemase [Geminicoccaceae bacterium]